MSSLSMEKNAHLIFGIPLWISLLLLKYFKIIPLDPNNDIYTGMLNITAISIGFLLTAKSIIFTVADTLIIKRLKDAEYKGVTYYEVLMSYFNSAIEWSFSLTVLSFIGLFTNCEKHFFAFWLFVSISTAIVCYKIIKIYLKMHI